MRTSALSLVLVAAGLVLAPLAGMANDSMAELKTGGLEFVRTDAITMVQEDLFISKDRIAVDYVFKNTTDADVDSLVAFPMPTVIPSAYEETGVPIEDTNFLGFKVFVENSEIQPDLSQRATALGVDVTDELLNVRMPLLPVSEATQNYLTLLPDAQIDDWLARGIVTAEFWDAGQGEERHLFPNWTLDQTYYWRMSFPAGQQVNVSHTYTPSVGGSAGVFFLDWEGKPSEAYADYEKRYCIDPPFVNAVKKRLKADGGISMTESWISYILTTGRNWFGPIGTFTLTVDKGDTSNLVSFCGTGVKKIGPTRFSLTYTDYYPENELDVLIMEPANW